MFAAFLYLQVDTKQHKLQHVETSNTIHVFQYLQASIAAFRRLICTQQSD